MLDEIESRIFHLAAEFLLCLGLLEDQDQSSPVVARPDLPHQDAFDGLLLVVECCLDHGLAWRKVGPTVSDVFVRRGRGGGNGKQVAQTSEAHSGSGGR
ncbi:MULTISPECIES: hypothetical protein [unclassified Bradyrhizobium]